MAKKEKKGAVLFISSEPTDPQVPDVRVGYPKAADLKLPDARITTLNSNEHSITALPFPSRTFDAVYCIGTLSHISGDDLTQALLEMQRVLAFGGKFNAIVYHKDSLLYAYNVLYWYGYKEGNLARLIGEKVDFGMTLSGAMSEQDLLSAYYEEVDGAPYTRAFTRDEARELFSKFFEDVLVTVENTVMILGDHAFIPTGMPDNLGFGWHVRITGSKS